MKKIFLLTMVIIAITKQASAQIEWRKYSQSYPNGTFDKPGNVGIAVMVKDENNSYWEHKDNNGLSRQLENLPARLPQRL